MSICESNCNYIGYEKETKESKCECTIKTQKILISDLYNQNYRLYYDNFTENTLTSNMASMKCVNTLFSKDGLLKNFVSYILLFSFFIFVISAIIFYRCGYEILLMELEQLVKEKKRKTKSK